MACYPFRDLIGPEFFKFGDTCVLIKLFKPVNITLTNDSRLYLELFTTERNTRKKNKNFSISPSPFYALCQHITILTANRLEGWQQN